MIVCRRPVARPRYRTEASPRPSTVLSLVFAFVFSPVGIVFGHIAKKQIRRTGEQGNGLATAGLVLSYIFTILVVLWFILVLVAAANSGTTAS